MALDAVVTAVADVLLTVQFGAAAAADQTLTSPPAHLPDDRVFVVYADPGEATLQSGQGGAGRVIYQADDEVRVEWHRRIARDAMTEAYPEALTVFTNTRDALFAAVKNGALNNTIVGFAGIRTDLFGPMEFWDADTTFGFAIALLIRHMTEAAT